MHSCPHRPTGQMHTSNLSHALSLAIYLFLSRSPSLSLSCFISVLSFSETHTTHTYTHTLSSKRISNESSGIQTSFYTGRMLQHPTCKPYLVLQIMSPPWPFVLLREVFPRSINRIMWRPLGGLSCPPLHPLISHRHHEKMHIRRIVYKFWHII